MYIYTNQQTTLRDIKTLKLLLICITNMRLFSSPLFSESRFKEKHSLDSDEEDYTIEETETGLDDEDLAAQEDCTIVS